MTSVKDDWIARAKALEQVWKTIEFSIDQDGSHGFAKEAMVTFARDVLKLADDMKRVTSDIYATSAAQRWAKANRNWMIDELKSQKKVK